MIPAKRHALIIQRLTERGVLSIAEISELLDVSQMTVRRDIRLLEDQGRALSVVGGIQLPERLLSEPSHLAKTTLAHHQKAAIGRFAANMVKPGSVIYLDAGTTILEIAHHLTTLPDLTVVTNDFVIAAFLSQESQCKLFHTGGEVERANQSCVGNAAGAFIHYFNFDIAFISTSSFSSQGTTTPDENKIPVKRAVIDNSAQSILITDSSKYGRIGTFNAVPIDRLNMIVTDNALPQNAQDSLSEHGIELHLIDFENNLKEG